MDRQKRRKKRKEIQCGKEKIEHAKLNAEILYCSLLYGYPVHTLFLETMENHVAFALSFAFAIQVRISVD